MTKAKGRSARRLVVFALALASAPVALASDVAGPVEIRVITYNTHGLASWIARDRPRERYPRLLELLRPYDVALLQEDFEHHDLVLAAATHAVVVRGNERSGLTALSSLPVLETEKIPYGSCSGWLRGASDCFASKGFLRVRVGLPEEAPLDLVTTHLDAGRGEEDHEVRATQVAVLVDRLSRAVPEGALVLAGDLNLRANDPEDRSTFQRLLAGLRLVDSGARPSPDLWTKQLDYVLYRSGRDLAIEVLGAGEAREFSDGDRLSDHPALSVHLRVTRPTASDGGGAARDGRRE